MCGICGIAGQADESLAIAMSDAIAHRGPDGSGIEVFPSVDGRMPATLAHRRLSVIDPTPRGAQPMQTPDGRYTITYNGEIYNFRELRSELQHDGMAFRTECDTEVLLALYARYGRGLLERLNGIYAFAIWDAERCELFLARDRLGVKPLYLSERDGALYFASEVKALLPAIGRPGLNTDVIPQYLAFLWVPDPATMFAGVTMLPAGHYAVYDRSGLRVSEWWDASFAPDPRPEATWVDCVREGVRSAVRRQMVSDVPLGSFLSGGLDSSAIVAEATAAAGRITTYTVGFSKDDLLYDIAPDDIGYSREVADRFDVDYHESILKPEIVSLLPKLIWHMDEPIADPAAITTYLICSAAKERLTVILSGMGGDEIFAGYPRYLAARLARVGDVMPAAIRRSVGGAIGARLTVGGPGRLRGPRRNLLKFVRGLGEDPLTRYLTHVSYYTPDELRGILSSDLRPLVDRRDPYERHRAYFDRVSGEHWLNQLLYVDLKTFLPCLNLTYTDKMSMAASTEVRVPLLDDDLVELASRVPADLKLRRTKRKYVLKRSQEGILPREVIWRPKAGFSAPHRAWLMGELRPLVHEILSPESIRARGLLDPRAVQRLIANNESGREDNAFRIWSLLTLELWQRIFLDADRSPVELPALASV